MSMFNRHLAAALAGLLLLGAAPEGRADPASQSTDAAQRDIKVHTVAEVETRAVVNGHEAIRLRPAERVVPGDQVLYTLEIRNVGPAPLPHPSVPYAIPDHMRYVEDSAIGPGAQVTFSVDGGHTFERAERLKVVGPAGRQRAATAADYTHIRWLFRHTLQPDSVAFARFRAVVQ